MTLPPRRLRLTFVSLLCLYPLIALAAQTPPSGAAAANAALEMHTGVRWCRGAEQGLFRVVVARDDDPSYQRLAIEVLQTDPDQRNLTVADTVPIPETHGQRLKFEGLHLRPAENYSCDDALVEALVQRDGAGGSSREKMRLRVSSTGQYSLRFVPVP